MDIGERVSFNAKVMHYCLKRTNWKQSEDQDECYKTFANCVTNTVIAEQLFRVELGRVRPGIFVYIED